MKDLLIGEIVLENSYPISDFAGNCEVAVEERCREFQMNTLSDGKFYFKKSWADFFVAISICNTVVVVDTMKSVDSGGSNYNEAFDDSTLSAADLDGIQDVNSADGPRSNSTKLSNGILSVGANGEVGHDDVPREPFVMYKSRCPGDNGKTQIKNHRTSNGFLDSPSRPCSTEYQATGKTPKLAKLKDEKPRYEAESPDEEALVKGAYWFGYALKARLPGSVRLRLPSGVETDFDLLHTLGFDSSRKRMSIIVRNPDGDIQLFCKGADTVIMSRLSNYSGIPYSCMYVY